MDDVIRVTAVTVTYNRTSTLRHCLSALLQQSRPVDEIIIVDNHSRDEEQDVLRELIRGHEHVHVLWLSENTGGAGGFEAGMREAMKTQPDWYWLMDDDAYPRADCLEKLLESDAAQSGAGFAAPLIYGVDFCKYQFFHHKYLRGLTLSNIPIARDVRDLKEETEVDANAFVGPLISGEAVRSVGMADGSLFIYGDDTEYTYRVSRKLKGYVIRDAVIDHQDLMLTDAQSDPAVWWKEYYSYRNRFFMIREFQDHPLRRVAGEWILALSLMKLLCAASVKPKYAGFRTLRIKLLVAAVRDGLTDRRGKTVDPTEYVQTVRMRREAR